MFASSVQVITETSLMANDDKVSLTSKDVDSIIGSGTLAERELTMQRKVGDQVETHGVYESEWKKNGDALTQDGWALVSE